MSIEGNITIKINRSEQSSGGPNLVEITSNRRTDIASFLKGKSPEEAISILPVIFNICGKAHAHAAKMACGQNHSNSFLTVLCENAREHLLRIFTGWDVDKKTDLNQIHFSEIMGLVARMETAIETDRPDIKQIARQIKEFLHTNIFHCSPQDFLELKTNEQLENWAEQTTSIAGQFIHNMYRENWQSIGSIEPDFLPDIPCEQLSEKMHQADAASFIAQPQWMGRCYETGSLARNNPHPLIAALAQKYGYGLLTRQIARLIELALIPTDIEHHAETPNADNIIQGFGQVETARGRLTHSVIINDDIITDYKILAPTEWNFHPRGALFESLQTLPISNEADTKNMAKMIIESIDPCVAYEVRVH